MANEAICYETPTKFARYTVADGTAITKGTLMKLTSPNTAIATSAAGDCFAGIAMEDKVANDGKVEITCALNGVWGLLSTASAITVGYQVRVGGANQVAQYTTLDDEKGQVVGRSLETIGASATVIKVRLGTGY